MGFSTQPLQAVIPAYLYAQYSGDANMQAFISAYNGMAQGYLDWFNNNPLGVYTNPNMTGDFLDWIGTELYGISRPVLGSTTVSSLGEYASAYYSELAYGEFIVSESGRSQAVGDDIYKRYLTWMLYLGDGKQMSIPWLKRRIARFIYGSNGGDVPVSEFQNISIAQPVSAAKGSYATQAYASSSYSSVEAGSQETGSALEIKIPVSGPSSYFAALVTDGWIALPFQVAFSISIQG